MRLIAILILGGICAGYASADIIDTVTLNTAPLEGNANGPFTIDFQLIEGNGLGDSNNIVTLSDFNAGGGSITSASAASSGGVEVTTDPFGVTLVDSSFLQDVELSLTPGSRLSFQFDATENVDAVAPDTFTFAILDSNLAATPTINPNGFDTFLELDLPTPGSGARIVASGTDLTRTAIDISAPIVQPQMLTTPEPSSLVLLPSILLLIVVGRRLL